MSHNRRRNDTSLGGRKRRCGGPSRNPPDPKRRRTDGDAEQESHHAPAPIGFKALENICRDESSEDAILELASKAGRFEALLCSEEIRPDLLKLVITSFRLLCSSNSMVTANAEKILRSPKAKKFITGPVLSRFINEMPYSSVTRFGTVIDDLTVVFSAMIQRFGESIVHDLPLPQLSASLAALNERNLVKDGNDLEKKLQDVKDLKDEVIRVAKTAHDQGSQAEPPQNFRELSVIPNAADLLCSRPFLRENITDRRFKDLDHYLDVQFRLLREDFAKPLRDGIKEITKDNNSLEPSSSKNARRAEDVSVYYNVTVLSPIYGNKGRLYRIRFDYSHPRVKRVNWERSKRLKFGSLLCLSSDEFASLVFATVENRDAAGLSVGELEVRFENLESEQVNELIQGKEKFVMIESPAYFEAYRHVLEALKEIKAEEFPFQRHIVECCQDVGPPEYHCQLNGTGEEKDAILFDFSGVKVKKRMSDNNRHTGPFSRLAAENELNIKTSESETQALKVVSPGKSEASIVHAHDLNSQHDNSAGVVTDSSNGLDVAMDNEMSHVIFEWPDKESLGLNKSQMGAFKLALTNQLAVIQGPPGTGKTYVGLKIARALLDNASLWKDEKKESPILMVSYTNHALDQFLEGLLPMQGMLSYLPTYLPTPT